jgi:hypothetical protein
VLDRRLVLCMMIITGWCEVASTHPDLSQDFAIVYAPQIRFDVDSSQAATLESV